MTGKIQVPEFKIDPTASTGSTSPDEISSASSETPVVRVTTTTGRRRSDKRAGTSANMTRALSMGFLRGLMCCQECSPQRVLSTVEYDEKYAPSELYNLQALKNTSSVSPLVTAPMLYNAGGCRSLPIIESIIGEYTAACRVYGCADRINAGVLTTIRFSLPSLRVTGSFHDADVLALCEILFRHANGALSYIQRLDFAIASKEGRRNNKLGFTSHGAFALSKVLQQTNHIHEVFLPRHKIGPYGASALFMACRDNASVHALGLRRCRIGERGALAFAELICTSLKTGLKDIDLSANGIGHRGTAAIERALLKREQSFPSLYPLSVNMEGNHVFPEIMNGCTHGLGVVLSVIGGISMAKRIEGQSRTHEISCAIYSTSLLVLYTSSTLYHSFFSLQNTKYVFEVLDKCAIYILIAGSYTPFLSVVLHDVKIWSIHLLGFIWVCCFLGIWVEACRPTWRYRGYFSLSMYLGMGWACLVCLPEISTRLPDTAVNYLILGGVGYTVGVPFFVRNNNLDHAVWHLFVLSGSIFHWLAIYLFVAPRPLPL